MQDSSTSTRRPDEFLASPPLPRPEARLTQSALERPLDGFETTMWVGSGVGRMNVLVIAHLRGTLEPEHLRGALAAVQQRQPMLRVRVGDGEGGPRWVEGVPPPSLRVVPRAGPDAWLPEAERALHHDFDMAQGPLAALTLVQGQGEHDLLLVFHHAIGDVASSVPLMRDALQAAAAIARGDQPGLAPLGPQPPLRDLNPLRPEDPRTRKAVRSEMLRSLRYLVRPPARLRADGAAPHRERRSRFVHRTLSPGETEALVERARAERTSVTGALGAALLLAVAEDLGKPARLMLLVPADLRPRVQGLDPEAFGWYSWGVASSQQVRPGDGLWPLARALREEVQHELERGSMWPALAMMERAAPKVLKTGRARMEQRMERNPGALVMSNLGRIDAPERIGELEWVGFHSTLNAQGAGAGIVATATTFRGTLAVNFVHTEPLMAHARAIALADRTMALACSARSGRA